MSKLSLTMKSLLAMGAATALTITASADEPKTKPEIAEDAKAMVAGSGGGKATFKELTEADYPGIKDESQTTINEGCEPYPACARNKEAMEEEIAAPVKSEGFKPAATGEVEKHLAGEDDDNDGFYWEASIDVIARPDDRTPDEDAETSVEKATVKDGEDRLTENLVLNSSVKGKPAEEVKDGEDRVTEDVGRPMQRD